MRIAKALEITRCWILRGDGMTPAVAAALALSATIALGGSVARRDARIAETRRRTVAALRVVAVAALRAIPSIDVIATRDEAKLGLRAVAALERRAVRLEAASPGGRRAA